MIAASTDEEEKRARIQKEIIRRLSHLPRARAMNTIMSRFDVETLEAMAPPLKTNVVNKSGVRVQHAGRVFWVATDDVGNVHTIRVEKPHPKFPGQVKRVTYWHASHRQQPTPGTTVALLIEKARSQ